MRILLAIAAAAALGWSGWWWWNASMREAAARDWLAERQADGWVAEAGALDVQGFPNRLDLVAEELMLADPEAEWSWTVPRFQVLSLTWKPHHVIAVWPGEQVFATPYETVTIASEQLRGSIIFLPRPGLALDRATVEIGNMRLTGAAGWEAALGEGILSVRRAEGDVAPDFSYDLHLIGETLALPESWTAGLERSGVLPGRMETAALDAQVSFDRPWDRHAIEEENPRLRAVAIHDLRVSWGQLDVRGQGELVADAEGYAEGRIDLRVRNWREMLNVAVGAGMIGETAASAVEVALGLMARMSSDPNSIQVPLVFAGGEARLGPIPVGDAPRLGRR